MNCLGLPFIFPPTASYTVFGILFGFFVTVTSPSFGEKLLTTIEVECCGEIGTISSFGGDLLNLNLFLLSFGLLLTEFLFCYCADLTILAEA